MYLVEVQKSTMCIITLTYPCVFLINQINNQEDIKFLFLLIILLEAIILQNLSSIYDLYILEVKIILNRLVNG